jgi:hypothetical protein
MYMRDIYEYVCTGVYYVRTELDTTQAKLTAGDEYVLETKSKL